MQVILLREPYCEFVEGETVTLIESRLGEDSIVLAAMGEAAMTLADYAQVGMAVEIENGMPSLQWNERVYSAARAYRWDWNLTPESETLFATAVKIPQSQSAFQAERIGS